MSDVGEKISLLLNSSNLSASKISNPLKEIGDGNMLNGVRTIFNFATEEGLAKGEKRGTIKGSIGTFIGIGTLYAGYTGVKYIKGRIHAKKAHLETGNKILKNLQTNADINSDYITETED